MEALKTLGVISSADGDHCIGLAHRIQTAKLAGCPERLLDSEISTQTYKVPSVVGKGGTVSPNRNIQRNAYRCSRLVSQPMGGRLEEGIVRERAIHEALSSLHRGLPKAQKTRPH
jgi:hypothetical protein